MKNRLIASFSVIMLLLTAVVSPVFAGYDKPLPNAECSNGKLTIFFNPQNTNTKVAIRIDDLSNGWNDKTPNAGDVIDNSFVGSSYTYNNAVKGRWYAWWFHQVDNKGVYGPAKSGFLQCPADKVTAPANIKHSYSEPTVTLSWDKVPGAKFYAIRVDNLKTPWSGDQNNMHDGDHLRNQMTETTFSFKAPKGRGISWWVYAISESGEWSQPKGEYFETPNPVQNISAPANIKHSYSYPNVTLSWDPVPGAEYYAIRVDNLSTPWNGDQNNLHDGDHLRNQMKETTFTFQAPKDRAISWWIHAISESGQWTASKGEYFVTPSN